MYLNFYNLNKEPFQITPDPSFLFLSPGHKGALASIIYGVEKKKGFILILGAVGVGKTTILRAYLEKVDREKLTTIYLFNSNISYANLLKYLLREVGLVPESDEVPDMVHQFHQALMKEYEKGKTILLLIDEAQNMPVDTLENLRMLSNLETDSEKLIQVIFSAQTEFEKTLNLEELQQLKQRIAVKAVINPLTHEEGLSYIQHRLKTAANDDGAIFTPAALRELVRSAKGIPRVINVLCDNSLITAFGYGKRPVDVRVVREITGNFGIRGQSYLPWVVGVLAMFAVALGGVGIKHRHLLSTPKATAVALPQAKRTVQVKPASQVVKPGQPLPAAGTAYAQRVVTKGDTLAKLIVDVYGHVNPKMIKMVKKANYMENEDLIIEGTRIVFPDLSKQ
ncbi:AAA family ATPase [Geomonas sp.]|uniref:AAA family ATPase n=1 Tax=Geomonas sp. TaxID=2651584 RepID=UPI002B45E413|nr:AAA family ATPase [Geomonas sp.]HJV35025.1 AAA family ATPase [Geomonas sp.]